MTQDTYWLPPALKLPKYTKNLFFSENLDFGVAWFLSRRVSLFHPRATELANLIPQKEMYVLFHISDILAGYSFLKDKKDYDLPYVDRGAFRIYTLGHINSYYNYESNTNPARSFLIFQRVEGGWKLYPRTLHSCSIDATPARVVTSKTFQHLEPHWTKAFADLPEFAWLDHQKYAGLPTLYGCTAETSSSYNSGDKWWDEHTHPFWQNARRALLALAAMERLSFPDPPEKFYNTFHWTVYGTQGDTAKRAICTLGIDLKYNAWGSIDDRDDTGLCPKKKDSLEKIKTALSQILKLHAPDVPYFFDCIHPETSSFYTSPEKVNVHTRSLHFPWISNEDAADVARTKTGHDALYHLSLLPPEWANSVTEAL